MSEKLADALRERRESVERIIQKLKELDQAAKSPDGVAVAETPGPSTALSPDSTIGMILLRINNFDDVLKWARQNFEPSDVLLLETKFKTKLRAHPERQEDVNYCRLVTLIFYLMATAQAAKVYGDFSHRAISDAFATHLDMYHTLHLLEIACHVSDVALQTYVLKAIIGEILAIHQDAPLSESQEVALARLCLLPEEGMPLEDTLPLLELSFAPDANMSSQINSHKNNRTNGSHAGTGNTTDAPRRENLSTIEEAIASLDKGSPALTQRYKVVLDQPYTGNGSNGNHGGNGNGHAKKYGVPYYPPDLTLCLRLSNVIGVSDIKRTTSPALVDKLTELWQTLLPLHIDLAEMHDFQ